MKFNWREDEKEKFYQEAERQLREAGIDFVGVDRRCFGVCGWNEKRKTVRAVLITLRALPYSCLSNAQKNKLKKLKNWECTDKYMQGESKPLFMHSRLTITEI